MPATISAAMIAATAQSTTRQNGGRQRVLATNWLRCCQRSFNPWPARPATSSHGELVTAAAATMTEHAGDTDFDGENVSAPVGDREADVDRGDHRESERVDGRCVEPPEEERCRCLGDSDCQSPDDRGSQSCADGLCERGDAHEDFGAMRHSDRMLASLGYQACAITCRWPDGFAVSVSGR